MSSVVLTLLMTVAASAQDHPFEIAQRAGAAYEGGRYAEAADLYARVVQLLPRSTAARVSVARALIRAGRTDAALEQLSKAVDFGVRFDAADPAWTPVRSDARFVRLESQMRARTTPLIRSKVAFTLPKDFVPENIAFDPKSGAFFAGSMYKAKIVRIAPDGAVTDFIPSRRDGLLSVLGMKVDVARRELWAVAGNYSDSPPMEVDDPATRGKAALFRFNVDDGKLLGTYWGPPKDGEHVQFNDLVVTPEGDVYATAGLQGIWRLRAGAATVELFLTRPGAFFNGIALSPDGALFAASHFEGVIRIDPASATASLVDLPPGMALGGIDGLYVHDGSLVAIQNGTDPIRVVRAWLNRR